MGMISSSVHAQMCLLLCELVQPRTPVSPALLSFGLCDGISVVIQLFLWRQTFQKSDSK